MTTKTDQPALPGGAMRAAILRDRVALALALPERPVSWHGLHEVMSSCDAALQSEAIAQLHRKRPKSPFGAFLCATLLDSFCNDTTELARAVDAAISGPLPLDAGLALMNIGFARCLRTAGSAGTLGQQVRDAGLLALSAHLGSRLPAPDAASPARGTSSSTLRRVAVLAPSLSTGYHAPTTMALAHACALVESGLAVTVFAAQESMVPRMHQWLGTPRRMALDEADNRLWPRPAQGTYDVRLPNRALSMGARLAWLAQAVNAFAPDACLFVGAHSPLLWPLHVRWPMVGVGTNTVAPIGPLDVWLCPAADAETWGAPIGHPQQQLYTQRLQLPRAAAVADLPHLGLPHARPLWLTSGSRLAHEITLPWYRGVAEALERHPTAHWVIVRAGSSLPEFVRTEHPRVHVLPFQKDLPALMLGCHAYLNPPRMGGGQSVALAMAHGLPALSLAGSDGGDKLGPDAARDLPDYFATLDRWMADDASRLDAGRAQQRRFDAVFDAAQGRDVVLDALRHALALRRPS